MNSHLIELFNDEALAVRIQKRLPQLFRIAELECLRTGKIGMQVGYVREDILVSLLIYKFGEINVKTDIPKNEPEVDVKLFGQPISVKTISSKSLTGVKLIWTVDAQNAKEFQENYHPSCDLLFTQIIWGSVGGLYYIPVEIQRSLLKSIGNQNYIKLPKVGTNPRGAEITNEALFSLIHNSETRVVEIMWEKPQIDYNIFKRWVEYWSEG